VTPAPGPLTVAEASLKLDSARFAAMNAVDASPKFKIAKARVDALASELEQARQGDDLQAKLEASAAWNSARLEYDRAHVAAIENDAGVKKAADVLDHANAAARLVADQAAAAESERSRQAAATAAAAQAEREKDPIYQAIKAHKVGIGMTADQVIQSVGKPQSVNRTTTAAGVNEQWVYGGGYVYLDNGIVTAVQSSH